MDRSVTQHRHIQDSAVTSPGDLLASEKTGIQPPTPPYSPPFKTRSQAQSQEHGTAQT